MKKIIKYLGIILLAVFCFWISLLITYILPYPLNKINLLWVFIVLMLFKYKNFSVVFFSFWLFFFLEIYTYSTPFGVILFSGVISGLFLFWLYKNVFTDYSFWASLALIVSTVTLFRLLYLFLSYLAATFFESEFMDVKNILLIYGWEILFTSSLLMLLYYFFKWLGKRYKIFSFN